MPRLSIRRLLIPAVMCAALAIALPAPARELGRAAAASPVITYVTGTNTPIVYVSGGGSPARRLGPGFNPLVSPDGRFVAASGPGPHGSSLVIYSLAGGATRRYGHYDLVASQPLGWSPDSRYLAVGEFGTLPRYSSKSGLEVIDTLTGSARVIARGAVAGASFSPYAPVRIAFALYRGGNLLGAADIYTAGVDGSARLQITHDHRSLNPLWGSANIVFDHERFRGRDAAPEYQLWAMEADGSNRLQLTHTRVDTLVDGLVPVALSADGTRLLASFEGQDTDFAYTVDLRSRQVHALSVGGVPVQAGGISRDGSRVLVSSIQLEDPPSKGVVLTLGFTGDAQSVLFRHASSPSWNG